MQKDPVWLFFSAVDDGCLDCNAEVSPKVLRLKSQCVETELLSFFNQKNIKPDLINQSFV